MPAIARIHVDAWRAAYRGQIPDTYLDSLDVEERTRMWSGVLSRPAPARLVVTDPLTGFCLFGASRDGEDGVAEIFAVYVRPDAWKHGAGRALCTHAEHDAQARECSSIALWTLRSNEQARHFYGRIGYAADGGERVNTRLTSTPLHEMRYRKVLG